MIGPDAEFGQPVIPVTSASLIKDISNHANSARWSEFVARYRPMMESYLQAKNRMIEKMRSIVAQLEAVDVGLG